MQIEGRKLMFILNFSVLDFFKVASRMPQTAQILVSTFKISRGACPQTLLHIIPLFFSLAIPGSDVGDGSWRSEEIVRNLELHL